MKLIIKYLVRLFKFIVVVSVFGGIMILYILWKYSPDLPNHSELKNYSPSLTTRVFTSDGQLLDEYFIEERLFVPIQKIPKKHTFSCH